MLDLILNSSITHSLLLILPIACALLLRWVRCPGSGLIGGVIAGLLLGPTFLGRWAPDPFEKMFVGGETERVEFDELARAHEIERAAAREAWGVDASLPEITARQETERKTALATWRAAQWTHQRPLRSFTAAITVLTLLGAGLRRLPRDAPESRGLAPLSIGPWSALVPGGIAMLVVWQWGRGAEVAALAAAAVAIGPWVLDESDRAVAEAAETGGSRTIERAGRIASITALAIIGATMAIHAPARALWALPLLALPAGWLLPVFTRRRREIDIALQYALVPCLAACVALKLELHAHFLLWPTIAFVLISGDGRWLGALTGALLAGGRRAMPATRLVLGSMACGPTQLAVIAMTLHAKAIPEDVALPLLIGAMLIEITAPARRSVAARLEEVEAEVDDQG